MIATLAMGPLGRVLLKELSPLGNKYQIPITKTNYQDTTWGGDIKLILVTALGTALGRGD